ncbi:plasmid partitioning/stability family protein [Marinobacter hydrocarbonoclasticus]|nr:plasmid partitioning/stability family protein [Marinobacter nauticus]
MRVSCSFTLSPEGSDADAHAVQLLKRWQKAEQSRDESADVLRQRRSDFHRQIYLSGLFLHQLAPKLPALLAASLDESPSAEQLLALAEGAGLNLRPDAGLSPAQWQKLTTLMATAPTLDPTPIIDALTGQASVGSAADMAPLLGEMASLQSGQKRTLALLTALSEQMADGDEGTPEKAAEPELAAQLEKAQKVKSKGLW